MQLHTPSRRILIHALVVIGLAIVIFAIYSHVLSFGFLTWDNYADILRNERVSQHSISAFRNIFFDVLVLYYTPLTLLSWNIEHLIFGFQPAVFHLDNILLHLLNAVLVYVICVRHSKRLWVGILAALLFSIHPLNVEVVAWLSTRKHLLGTAFALLTLITYQSKTTTSYLLSIAFFVAALASSVTSIGIVLVLLLINKNLFRVFPFALVALMFGAIGFGTEGVYDRVVSIPIILFIYCKGILLMLWHFIWPFNLSPIYSQSLPVIWWSPVSILVVVVGALLLALFVRFRKKLKIAYLPLSFFVLMVIPLVFAIQKEDGLFITQDRYAYLPTIGLLYLIAVGVETLWHKFNHVRILIASVTTIIIVFFSVVAYQRTFVWENDEVFYRALVAHQPSYIFGYLGLGKALEDSGFESEATDVYRQALLIDPIAVSKNLRRTESDILPLLIE